jgi:photosystem II stability/assembly factor-like uncharacterized protein
MRNYGPLINYPPLLLVLGCVALVMGSAFAQPQSIKRKKAVKPKTATTASYPIMFRAVKLSPSGGLWVAGTAFRPHPRPHQYQGILIGEENSRVITRAVPDLASVDDLTFASEDAAWAICSGKLYRSTEKGTHWEDAHIDTDFELSHVVFTDSFRGWVVGHDGIIYHTDNGGVAWTQQDSGTDLNLEMVQFVDPLHGWIIGEKRSGAWPLEWSHILLGTSDGGKTWNTLATERQFALRSISFVNIKEGWGIDHSDNILHTTDGGTTWNKQRTGNGTAMTSIFFVSADEGWAVGDDILYSNDGGMTWKNQLRQSRPEDGRIEAVAFKDKQHGWAIRINEILSTIDGGKSWKPIFSKDSDPRTHFSEVDAALFRSSNR